MTLEEYRDSFDDCIRKRIEDSSREKYYGAIKRFITFCSVNAIIVLDANGELIVPIPDESMLLWLAKLRLKPNGKPMSDSTIKQAIGAFKMVLADKKKHVSFDTQLQMRTFLSSPEIPFTKDS